MTDERRAIVKRETKETRIVVELVIDGTGEYEVNTGVGMLDHLVAQLARHGAFNLKVEAKGDLESDPHHTVEDVAICLGKAFNQALGERRGLVRMGHAIVPMDEALALVAVDAGGRGKAVIEAGLSGQKLGELPADLIDHFLESFAIEARINLHARLLTGTNDHHKAEAIFKALARALDEATRVDPRIAEKVPSTKGTLSE